MAIPALPADYAAVDDTEKGDYCGAFEFCVEEETGESTRRSVLVIVVMTVSPQRTIAFFVLLRVPAKYSSVKAQRVVQGFISREIVKDISLCFLSMS